MRNRIINMDAPPIMLRCVRCGRRSARAKFIPDEGMVCRECVKLVNQVGEEPDVEQPVYASS